MHLVDVMIDVNTGNPIVVGKVTMALGKESPIVLPAHTHLMLDFRRVGYRSLGCHVITQMKRLDNGFYSVTDPEPHLMIGPFDFARYVEIAGREYRTSVRATRCGAMWDSHRVLYEIVAFELIQQLQSDGMAFVINGTFGLSQESNSQTLQSDGGFEISGLVPWETLKLYDLPAGLRRHAFISEPWDRDSIPIGSIDGLESFDLADLRVGLSMKESLAAGHMEVSGLRGAQRIVAVQCNSSGLTLHGADQAVRAKDGFCLPKHRPEIGFHSTPITLSWIEQLLKERDRVEIRLSGDDVGQIYYETGRRLEPGLYEGIGLKAEHLDLEAYLSRAGLHISLAAKLGSLQSRTTSIGESVTEPNHRTGFSAAVILQWSLLLVVGSQLADRRSTFVNAPTHNENLE